MGFVVVAVPPEAVGEVQKADQDATLDASVGDTEKAVKAEMTPGVVEQAVVGVPGTRGVVDRFLAGELERLGGRAARSDSVEGHEAPRWWVF